MAYALWAMMQPAQAAQVDSATSNDPQAAPGRTDFGLTNAITTASDFIGGFVNSLTGWDVSKIPAQYVGAIGNAERANGIPMFMLARLLWQESHYRADIISGKTVSSAGALGIAQIVPKWHPNVDPLDPFASIAYAGQYLGSLYKKYGDWAEALAAYNWGPGNLDNYGIANAPAETRAYYKSILADIGMSTGVA